MSAKLVTPAELEHADPAKVWCVEFLTKVGCADGFYRASLLRLLLSGVRRPCRLDDRRAGAAALYRTGRLSSLAADLPAQELTRPPKCWLRFAPPKCNCSVLQVAAMCSERIAGAQGATGSASPGYPGSPHLLAAVSALRAFGARRVAIISPPWFGKEMDRSGAEYFQHQGFDVVYHARALVRNDRGNVYPGPLYELASDRKPF